MLLVEPLHISQELRFQITANRNERLCHLQLEITLFAYACISLAPQWGEGLRVRGGRAKNSEISNWIWY